MEQEVNPHSRAIRRIKERFPSPADRTVILGAMADVAEYYEYWSQNRAIFAFGLGALIGIVVGLLIVA